MTILNSAVGNYIIHNHKKYSYFAGNNYLGLANHQDVKKAALKCIKKYGVNFAASRCTTGTAEIHIELEKKLAAFKNKENAIVFASGYQGNSILLHVLKDRYSAVFIDQFAHPSIVSGIPKEISNIYYYRHCDSSHLENLIELHKVENPLIITDGIFALTGEIAPLDKIYHLIIKYNAILIVDDAHSTGVLGKNGRGTPEHFNLPDNENIYQTETMSKALGSYGGFISGSDEIVDIIQKSSATYQASTALTPPTVGAGLGSLKVIAEKPELRLRLLEKSIELRKEIAALGFHTTKDNTPIIPIILSKASQAKNLSAFLEEHRIIVPHVDYPIKLGSSMIRITVSANHTNNQTAQLLEILTKWKNKNGTN